MEISLVQHHSDEILFKLTMGAYSRHPYASTHGTHHASSHSPITVAFDHQNCASSSSSSPSVYSPSSSQAHATQHSESAQFLLIDNMCYFENVYVK
jgi:hypothetical protein